MTVLWFSFSYALFAVSNLQDLKGTFKKLFFAGLLTGAFSLLAIYVWHALDFRLRALADLHGQTLF